ncbi:MAG: hypothetical protein ABSH09_30290 [Bryobacteraceae bacterium]
MKEYLLGVLNENDAARIEEEYFADPAFFESVCSAEEELIIEYLKGELSLPERERFEARYFQNPELKKRFDAVQIRNPGRSRKSFHLWKLAAGAAFLVFCGVAFWVWVPGRHSGPQTVAKAGPPATPIAILTVHLTPGLLKSIGSRQMEFTPPPGGSVQLLFELPGRRSPLDCEIVISKIDSDDRQETVWSSGGLKTETAGTGQQARAGIDSARLGPGDYMARVLSGGSVLETYSFRVNNAP